MFEYFSAFLSTPETLLDGIGIAASIKFCDFNNSNVFFGS